MADCLVALDGSCITSKNPAFIDVWESLPNGTGRRLDMDALALDPVPESAATFEARLALELIGADPANEALSPAELDLLLQEMLSGIEYEDHIDEHEGQTEHVSIVFTITPAEALENLRRDLRPVTRADDLLATAADTATIGATYCRASQRILIPRARARRTVRRGVNRGSPKSAGDLPGEHVGARRGGWAL